MVAVIDQRVAVIDQKLDTVIKSNKNIVDDDKDGGWVNVNQLLSDDED